MENLELEARENGIARRDFIKLSAGAGVMMALDPLGISAASPAEQPVSIDLHTHWVPEAYDKALSQLKRPTTPSTNPLDFDLDKRRKWMDEHGVRLHVLTLSGGMPVGWGSGTGWNADQLVAHSGSVSYRRATGANTSAQTLQLKAGTYLLSAWIKTASLGSGSSSGVRLTLDYDEDLAFFTAIFEARYEPGKVLGVEEIVDLGIALVPEGRGIFPTLTVTENLRVAQRPGRWTQQRALATGALSLQFAWFFTIAAVALFFVAAWQLNPFALKLAPLAIAILFFYSFTKRFTNWSHIFLGFGLGISPAAAWIAALGKVGIDPAGPT